MEDTAEDAKQDLRAASDYFYEAGPGLRYHRTETIKKVEAVSKVKRTQDGVAIEAGYNENASYLSGSRPTVGEVLLLADQGVPFTTKNGADARPTVGNKGFWQKAQDSMKDSLRKEMKKHFK